MGNIFFLFLTLNFRYFFMKLLHNIFFYYLMLGLWNKVPIKFFNVLDINLKNFIRRPLKYCFKGEKHIFFYFLLLISGFFMKLLHDIFFLYSLTWGPWNKVSTKVFNVLNINLKNYIRWPLKHDSKGEKHTLFFNFFS